MPFRRMRYQKRTATFHECGDCGKKFTEGEFVYVQSGYKNHVVAYLCDKCYEKKYIDL